MVSSRKVSSSGREVVCERSRWRRESDCLDGIMFFIGGERKEEDVRERVIGGRVGEGVGSVEADEAEVIRCGSGRKERCGVMRGVSASIASPMSLFRRDFRLTFT